METFAWDVNFVTGLDQVDAQHHQLVDLFNELNESMFSTEANREAVIESAFSRVVDYTNYHFRDEEQLMQDEGVDSHHIELHKALHQQFVEQVKSLWTQRSIINDNPEILIEFLTAWLGMHILGVDQSLARQIRRIRDGMDAAHAWQLEASAHDNSTQALLKMINKLYHVLSTQNNELALANAQLETRVRERTQELANANAELRLANQQLEAFSQTDGLLQIANRTNFDGRMALACQHSHHHGQPLGLLMIDVDYFKRYNDTYGHQAGDECLKAIASAVKQALLNDTGLVARYGGEELVVILPDTDRDGVQRMSQRIVEAVAALQLPHRKSDAATYVTVSVGGVSRVARSADDQANIIAAADAALYKAKESGRNRYCLAN